MEIANAEMSRPPDQHSAAARAARRGPARSSQPPNRAADAPRSTIARVNVQPRSLWRQLQVVVTAAVHSDIRAHSAGGVPPIAASSGFQNTENP